MTTLMPTTARALKVALAGAQVRERLPSVAAGVLRGGALVWTGARGLVDGAVPGPRTQYRIGSITKTFVAVALARLAEQGAVGLQDTVGDHLEELAGTGVGGLTVGALLAQSSGLQAETDGPWWERTAGGGWDALLPLLRSPQALRHRPGTRYHYSNLGFAVLAQVVARRRGAPWSQVVEGELLAAAGMAETTARPREPAAPGLAVHPWADAVLAEPEHDAGAMAPAGQLWSTVGDLARWARVLAGLEPAVLSPAAAASMRAVQVVDDPTGPAGAPGAGAGAGAGAWTTGYGLGLQLWNEGGRRWFGHTGSMPGFVALLRLADDGSAAGQEGDGVVVVANSTAGFGALGGELLDVLRTHEPPLPAPWVPSGLPAELSDLVGPWYWGPAPLVLSAWGSGGDLELTALARPGRGGRARSSRFRPTGPGRWVGLDGYYAGEVLRVVPSPTAPATAPATGAAGGAAGERAGGRVHHLDLASFRLTRTPYERGADVPGGVDDGGWTDGAWTDGASS